MLTGPKGAPRLRGSWNGKWNAVRKAVGCDGLRFHDLRHTGNTLAAATGASTKELMARVGHSSARAALHYQHATKERECVDDHRPVVTARVFDLGERAEVFPGEAFDQ